MGKLMDIMTEINIPIRTIVEVVKDLVPEAVFEVTPDSTKQNENCSDTEDSSEDISSEEENKDTKKKDKGGIRLMAVDTTKTVLINLKLDAENFTKFKCNKPKIRLGVNLVCLHKLIKSMDKDDDLTLFAEDENYLQIKIDNEYKKSKTIYKLKLMDLDTAPMSIPDITFDAVVTMNSVEFHRICREMYSIATHVEIKCMNNKIVFTCKGDAERSTEYMTDSSGDGVNIQHSGTNSNGSPLVIQGVYELKNLVLFSKCASLCNEIQIYMKNNHPENYPLVIKYTVATLGRILLCLAPINEDNTNDLDFSDGDEYYAEDVKYLHDTN